MVSASALCRAVTVRPNARRRRTAGQHSQGGPYGAGALSLGLRARGRAESGWVHRSSGSVGLPITTHTHHTREDKRASPRPCPGGRRSGLRSWAARCRRCCCFSPSQACRPSSARTRVRSRHARSSARTSRAPPPAPVSAAAAPLSVTQRCAPHAHRSGRRQRALGRLSGQRLGALERPVGRDDGARRHGSGGVGVGAAAERAGRLVLRRALARLVRALRRARETNQQTERARQGPAARHGQGCATAGSAGRSPVSGRARWAPGRRRRAAVAPGRPPPWASWVGRRGCRRRRRRRRRPAARGTAPGGAGAWGTPCTRCATSPGPARRAHPAAPPAARWRVSKPGCAGTAAGPPVGPHARPP